MSIFSSIVNAEHTFAAWAEKELALLYKDAPKIEAVADTVLKYAGSALQIIVTAEAGNAAGAVVGSVVSQAQSDLTVASGLISDFGATPTAASLVSSVQSNLSGLLTASHITNSTSVSNVTKVVSSLGALATALTASAAPPATS